MKLQDIRNRGFSLIELVFALAVIAILATLAFPSYTSAMQTSRRVEGKVLLQSVIAAEERYYSGNNRYADDMGSAGLGMSGDSAPGHYYAVVRLAVAADSQFVEVTVEPRNAQQNDRCGSLSLDSLGRHSAGGDGRDCW